MNNEIFDEEQFINFSSIDKSKFVYVTSVVSRWLLRNSDSNIHTYGRAVAERGNSRLEARFGNIPPDKENRYLGFYSVRVCDVRKLQMEHYSIHIRWKVEDDCDAHFQIEMWDAGSQSSKVEKRNERIVAARQIWQRMIGPVLDAENERLAASLLPNMAHSASA